MYRVANFSKDVSDGENYTVLLNQLKPELCSRDPLNEPDLLERAETLIKRTIVSLLRYQLARRKRG